MITLTFDTETTGIPASAYTWQLQYRSFPFVASIAWQVHEDDKLLYEAHHYIRPEGWEMPADAAAVNKLSTELLLERGHRAINVFRHIITDMSLADKIIGHNIGFDTKMLKSNLMKLGVPQESFNGPMDKTKRICTMQHAMKMPEYAGKWIKLTALYENMVGEELDGAHDAMNDVRATFKIYRKMLEQGIIK